MMNKLYFNNTFKKVYIKRCITERTHKINIVWQTANFCKAMRKRCQIHTFIANSLQMKGITITVSQMKEQNNNSAPQFLSQNNNYLIHIFFHSQQPFILSWSNIYSFVISILFAPNTFK